MDMMLVRGNYTLSSFFSKAEGPFTVILKNVLVKGNASLAVERDGQIRTQDISMDITFSDMSMDFQNLGNLNCALQKAIYVYRLYNYTYIFRARLHGQHFPGYR